MTDYHSVTPHLRIAQEAPDRFVCQELLPATWWRKARWVPLQFTVLSLFSSAQDLPASDDLIGALSWFWHFRLIPRDLMFSLWKRWKANGYITGP